MLDVRDATPADAHGIATVDVTSWQATYRGLIADDVLASMSVTDHERHWLDRITGAPPLSHTLVLTRRAAVLGFAATGPARMTDDHTTGELHALYLAPDAWVYGLVHGCTPAPSTASELAGSSAPASGFLTTTPAPAASTTGTAGTTPGTPSSTNRAVGY